MKAAGGEMRVVDKFFGKKGRRSSIWLLFLCAAVLSLLCGCAGIGRNAAEVRGAGTNPLSVREFVSETEGRAGTEAEEKEETDVGDVVGNNAGIEQNMGNTEGNIEETKSGVGDFEKEGTIHRGVLTGEKQELLTEGQKEAIFRYMDRYYEALSSLTMKDLSDLFAEDAAGQLAFHENALEYMIGLRRMQKADLRMDDYFYRMRILEVQPKEDGSVDVGMAEQNLLRFALMPEVTSECPGCRHDFTLVRENGRWVLSGHMQWDGAFWNMLKGHQDQDLERLADAARVFTERKELLLGEAADDLREREGTAGQEAEGSSGTESAGRYSAGAEGSSGTESAGRYSAGAGSPSGTESAAGSSGAPFSDGIPLHAYDRGAAVAYARAYVGERNKDWHDYSREGGNCQNFVSQCLFAGGIPMDDTGEAKWNWYGKALPDGSGTAGCTLSWINVDAFRAYARDNQGEGLAAVVDADFLSGEKGDLIMMGTPADWNHVVIISEVVKDENGRTVDYMICSNTTDVRDFPVSAYPSTGRSLIRILGWN